MSTHTRQSDGRYVVALPFKPEHEPLGESKSLAIKRFLSLEKRFSKDEELRAEYVNFMREYQDLGHMQPVSHNVHPSVDYYIPHHPVFKPTSTVMCFRFHAMRIDVISVVYFPFIHLLDRPH